MSGINHAFTSAKADGSDSSLVKPSDWNADHKITGTITPVSNDIAALGSQSLAFSDMYLADGGIIDWSSGSVQIYTGAISGITGNSVLNIGLPPADSTLFLRSTSQQPHLNFFADNSAPAAFDFLGEFNTWGRNASGFPKRFVGFLVQSSSITNGSEGGTWSLYTVAGGTFASRAFIGQGLYMSGVSSGGDMGPGTINGSAVYDDGNLLT